MGLSDKAAHTTLPVTDVDRAEAWYREKLGLRGERSPGGIMCSAGAGTRFLLFQSQGSASGTHTQMGFTVDDIRASVDELRGRGVAFEEYDMPNFRTEGGVVQTPAGYSAWFKDSEGNLLGLFQAA
jgi:catechol 2,3-dioxygenase-like lactoylglutathione lyase family enzyme